MNRCQLRVPRLLTLVTGMAVLCGNRGLADGIPWPEALAGKLFSQDAENNLGYRPPASKRLFLSISPLNEDRSDLAPYWGEKDNLPLPASSPSPSKMVPFRVRATASWN